LTARPPSYASWPREDQNAYYDGIVADSDRADPSVGFVSSSGGHISSPEESVTGIRKPNGLGSNDLITEDQAAIEFARRYAGRLRYCHDAGSWYEWNGAIWRQNRTGVAFQFARELARDLAASEVEKVRYITSKTSFAAGVERFSRSDPMFAATSAHWDKNPMLLGTPGGVVDLTTGLLSPSDSADGITKSTAVAPAEKPECPLWRRFLNEATNSDEGMVRFLQQWFGYSLTGDVREQALVFVYGPGGNGKSVFINVLTGVMADYAATPTMESLTVSKGERHSTDIAMLRGARIATASETEHGRPWAEARIKQLTGGDAITARFMRQDNFTFKPTFKLLIVGNHTPRLRNVDDAIRRRFNIAPFVHKPDSPDRQLEAKLKDEWPAILRWAIEGCLDWQKNGLMRPASVKAATGKYFADQDLWTQWLDEECDAEPGNRWKMAGSGELFQSWTAYARAAGAEAGSRVEFAENLEKLGFEPDKGTRGRRVWRGVGLRAQGEEQ
jgi:putative DNA primase/helicase